MTYTYCQRKNNGGISIHTLLAESDCFRRKQQTSSAYFNPHSPRREWRMNSSVIVKMMTFQSTLSSQRVTAKSPKCSILLIGILHTYHIFYISIFYFNTYITFFPIKYRCESPWYFMFTWHSHLQKKNTLHKCAEYSFACWYFYSKYQKYFPIQQSLLSLSHTPGRKKSSAGSI